MPELTFHFRRRTIRFRRRTIQFRRRNILFGQIFGCVIAGDIIVDGRSADPTISDGTGGGFSGCSRSFSGC